MRHCSCLAITPQSEFLQKTPWSWNWLIKEKAVRVQMNSFSHSLSYLTQDFAGQNNASVKRSCTQSAGTEWRNRTSGESPVTCWIRRVHLASETEEYTYFIIFCDHYAELWNIPCEISKSILLKFAACHKKRISLSLDFMFNGNVFLTLVPDLAVFWFCECWLCYVLLSLNNPFNKQS